MISSPPGATDDSASDENTASARMLVEALVGFAGGGDWRPENDVLEAIEDQTRAGGRLAGARAGHQVAATHPGKPAVRGDAHETVAGLSAADGLAPFEVRVGGEAHRSIGYLIPQLECRAAEVNNRSTKASRRSTIPQKVRSRRERSLPACGVSRCESG
jgi:hypothetical protein